MIWRHVWEFWADIFTVPSSANLYTEVFGLLVISCRRSWTYILNNIGDRTDPWGNPYSEHCLVHPISPLTLMLTLRVNRKLLSSCAICPLIPSLWSLNRSPFFHTLSNAFSKSIKRQSMVRCFSLSARIPRCNRFRYLMVFFLGEKPYV